MEDNKDMVTATETAEEKNTQGEDKAEKTYSRDELNKIINAERNKIKAEILKEEEEKRTEAEKLAKMKADEKLEYEKQKETDRANKAEMELNAYKLKDTAIQIANEKRLDVKLLDMIDFTRESAETINSKIESMTKLFKDAVEKGINESLKEKSPRYVVGTTENSKKNISRASY